MKNDNFGSNPPLSGSPAMPKTPEACSSSETIPLNDDTRCILGMMAVSAVPYANFLRHAGHDIQRKIECEQAAVIHWLLNIYLRHGVCWRVEAINQIKEMRAKISELATKAAEL